MLTFCSSIKSTVFSKRDLRAAARLLCADITNAEENCSRLCCRVTDVMKC